MKKTLAIITSLAMAAAAASAEELVSIDFTKLTGNSDTTDLPTGWTVGQWNGSNTPRYEFSTNGAIVKQPWKQNYLAYNLTTTPVVSDEITVINFSTYASTNDTQNTFFLSSGSYSILIGNSYTNNATVAVGTTAGDIANGGKLATFQTGSGRTVVPTLTATEVSGDMVNVGTSLDYTVTVKAGSLALEVTDGTNTYNATYAIADTFSFDSIGVINDGAVGTAGVKSLSAKTIPEPATATLSLLALAGLVARRRRK